MKKKKEIMYFYIFILPWIIGFLIFTIYPMLSSIYYSFTNYNVINPPEFIGLENYTYMLQDELIGYSVKATLYYSLISVPFTLLLSLGLAMLLNQKMPMKGFFRTAMYLPSMISGVAMSLLWIWIFRPQIGLLNYMLSIFGIEGPLWLLDKDWAIPALILMNAWRTGGGMIIFLAALQGVPATYYEAAIIDGARPLRRFWNITLPFISPVFLFQLIMGIIGSFQVFTQAYVMTRGGPNYATLFYVYYLYQNAFSSFKMGYASAMSWVLAIIIGLMTFLILKFSDKFVYYEGGKQ